MTYGLTETGFVKKPLEVLIEERKADVLLLYPDAVFDPEKSITNFVVAAAERDYALWNLFEALYSGNNVYTASGIVLDYLLTLNAMKRLLASYSYINGVKIVGIPGTVVPANFVIKSIVDPTIKFETTVEVTIGADTGVYAPASYGDVTVVLQSLEKTRITAAAGTITDVEKGLFGVEQVLQPEDATPGADIETDEIFLARREKNITLVKSATERGITAALDALNEDATKVRLTYIDASSNRNSFTDGRGRPAHCVECVVEQADLGTSRDQEIAQTIFDATGAGVTIYGEEVAKTVYDIRNRPFFASFTKPIAVPIYCAITIFVTTELNASELAQLALDVATAGNLLGVGVNVSVLGKKGLAQYILNDKILYGEIKIGKSVAPTGLFVDISSGISSTPERATFSTANITISQTVGIDE